MPRLEMRLLGSFQVSLDGQPVTGFESDKARALLAYMTVEMNRPHRRERLAGLLWSELPENTARAYLRRVLANVRRVIGDHKAEPPFLLIDRQTIQFNQAGDYWLDFQAFLTALKPDESGKIACRDLEQEITNFGGSFLEGFSIPDSIAFEEWLLLQREKVERGMQDAFQHLVSASKQRGKYDRAMDFAKRWVDLAPWDERAYQELMRLLFQNGQRSQALGQYNRCRKLLWDELGVTPSAETDELYAAISEGQYEGALPGSDNVYAKVSNNLPRNLSPLVGRGEEMTDLVDMIANQIAWLITITGLGGTGKTRLALAVAEQCLRKTLFPDGVFFVSLVGIASPEQIPAAVAEALQINLESGTRGLLNFLSHKKMLLLLDNFEHLLDGTELIVEILAAAPYVQLLVTSRERLGLRNEQLIPLLGLPYPEAMDEATVSPEAIMENESIELFLQRARLFEPGFEALPEDLSALVGICQYVAGLPLALELAAGWVDSLPLIEIEAGIQQDIDFLTSQLRNQPSRHRSMRAVFYTTWNRLPPAEQSLFARSSIFRGGFTRRAAQRICDNSLVSLASLVRKSFINYDNVQKRYRVHELMRQYGSDLLHQDGGTEFEIQEKHALYFCEWMGEQDARLKSNDQERALSQIESDLSNVLAAADWALDHENLPLLQKVIHPLGLYFWYRSYWDGKAFFQKVADSLASGTTRQTPERAKIYALALTWQCRFSKSLGDSTTAQQLANISLALLQELEVDTSPERAYLQYQMGYLLYGSKPVSAQAAFEESCILYEAAGDDWGQASALLGLGRVLRNLGQFDSAEHAVRKALVLGQHLGDQTICAEAVAMLGFLAFRQDHNELAEELFRESLAMTPARFRTLKAYVKAIFGFVLIQVGKFHEAKDAFCESLAALTEIGDRSTVPGYLSGLATTYLQLGDYENAKCKAEEGLQLSLQVGHNDDASFALYILGGVDLVKKRYQQAASRFQESKRLVEIDFTPPEMVDSNLSGLGMAALGLGNRPLARQYLITELTEALESYTHHRAKDALLGFALLFADQGQEEDAVRLHALVNRYPLISKSRWYADIAGDHLTAVAARLPVTIAEQAREQGRNLDLWETVRGIIRGVTDTSNHAKESL
jgi:DNA-binding SARP family transcriptional activator/predicted ATPase